ncbi:MAG: tetratricopeptide repeat protein, partial [Nitrospinota bacterium]
PSTRESETVEYDPLGDEDISEARLIETDVPPSSEDGETTSDEPFAEPLAEPSEPPGTETEPAEEDSLKPDTRAEKEDGVQALLSRPRELVMEYGLPDPPLLDVWRPLGSSAAENGGEADGTSPGVQLPESFGAVLNGVIRAFEQVERKGEFIPPETYYYLALLSFFAGEFESAVAYLQLALDAGFDPARAFNLLGLTYHLQGFEAEAETRLQEAAETEGVSPAEQANILTNLALASTYRRAPDDAVAYYSQALEIHRQLGDRQAQAETLSRMGRLCRAKHSLLDASSYHEEALEKWRQLGDGPKVAFELRLLAAVFRAKGDYAEALDLSQRALAMNRELGDHREEAINLGNIGLIYSLEKDLSKALQFFQAARSLHRKVGNFKGEASNLGNIGNVLFLQGKTEEALESYLSALKINRQIGYRWGEAVDLSNIGKIQMLENDLAAAATSLRGAHRILVELNATAQAEAIEDSLKQIGAHLHVES